MNAARKYTPQVIEIITNNILLNRDKLSEMIGVGRGGLRKKITELRNSGLDLPHGKICKLGDITTRKDGRFKRRFIKTEKGWRRLPLSDEEKELRKPLYKKRTSQPKKKKPRPPKKHVVAFKSQRPQPKPFQRKEIDTTNMHYVKIDNRTWALRRKND